MKVNHLHLSTLVNNLFTLISLPSMTGDPDVCTNRVENAVYVAAGNDPYELLEVR